MIETCVDQTNGRYYLDEASIIVAAAWFGPWRRTTNGLLVQCGLHLQCSQSRRSKTRWCCDAVLPSSAVGDSTMYPQQRTRLLHSISSYKMSLRASGARQNVTADMP